MTINLLQMYEANYPEILKACHAINGVYIFYVYHFSNHGSLPSP